MRLEAPYYAKSDAEEQGLLSVQYPRVHTDGAPEPNVTHTIEQTKYEIY